LLSQRVALQSRSGRSRLLRGEDDIGYLLRALRNTFSERRTESRRLRPGPLPQQLDLVADPYARQPHAVLKAGELYSAVAARPDDFRDVLVAVDITGLSYEEAAGALPIPKGTVMSRLYRARQQVGGAAARLRPGLTSPGNICRWGES
jgi:RNA polymerase sigma-70 factor (ECF subfamily)